MEWSLPGSKGKGESDHAYKHEILETGQATRHKKFGTLTSWRRATIPAPTSVQQKINFYLVLPLLLWVSIISISFYPNLVVLKVKFKFSWGITILHEIQRLIVLRESISRCSECSNNNNNQ